MLDGDPRGGVEHNLSPFGLSLSKARTFFYASKKDSPWTVIR